MVGRKFKVVTTWVVEVSEEELMAVEQQIQVEVDPRKVAVYKAMERTIEVLSSEGVWDDVVTIYFDVQEVTN